MRGKLITGINSAAPTYSICVEADLISLGGIYSLQTDVLCADNKCVTVNNSWHACMLGSIGRQGERPNSKYNSLGVVHRGKIHQRYFARNDHET